MHRHTMETASTNRSSTKRTAGSRAVAKTLAAVIVGLAASLALGSAVGATPPEEQFTGNDRVWLCHEDGFVAPSHCLNIKSQGATGLIMVFPPDDRGPAEGVAGAEVDSRPCPHDPGSDDGTWWEVIPGTYVCHHQP